VRLTPVTLGHLQQSADQNGRSISEEIEYRVEMSLTHALTEHTLTEMLTAGGMATTALINEQRAALEALKAEAAAMIRQELAAAFASLGEAARAKEIADLRRERDALIGLVETTLALTRADKGEEKK
jgi:hypothetical protein